MKAKMWNQLCLGFLFCALVSSPVEASFHFMQIERVIGGVSGDATAQAIQLRMRTSSQNFVASTRIIAWDSAGQNPITIVVFSANVSNNVAGATILVASPAFVDRTNPPTNPDAVMANLIPPSYLLAGSLTFEDSLGTILWRLSWGGAAYTGSTTGSLTNDADGDFGPPWPDALPSADLRSLQFQGAASSLSSSNAADYALSADPAAFTNNAGNAFVLAPPPGACCVEVRGECLEGLDQSACDAEGGIFGGTGTTCATVAAPCNSVLTVGLELVADGLVSPVLATHAGDASGRLFIVDQVGQIWIMKDGVTLATPFLDVAARIIEPNPGFDERGLLGLAFHPNYASNGRFFVRYSAPRVGVPGEPCEGTTRGCHSAIVAEYAVSAGDADVADLSSEVVLFAIDEPEFNHDAGSISFGPDGFLYFSLGDGGGRDDGLSSVPVAHGPIGNGQNIDTLLGSVLRIDVDSTPGAGLSYAIPADNPFVGVTGADEIYAYGFRNPFRFSFDDGTGGDGTLYLGDVGQDLFEEVDIVVKGGNYGWVIREGTRCFDPMDPFTPPAACPAVGTVLGDPLIDPVMDYLQPIGCTTDADCAAFGVGCGSNGRCLDEGGISVIAGNVYRGARLPGMNGKFVFGDFSDSFGVPGGRLYYFDTTGPDAFKRREFHLTVEGGALNRFVKGMGQDGAGELYVCATDVLGPTGTSGVVLKIVAPTAQASGVSPRYLAITLPDGPAPVGITITPDCPGGVTQHVATPTGSDNVALLVPGNPGAFLLPSQWGTTVHVAGIDIVPSTTYKVQIDNGVANSPELSVAVTATTSAWGDVAGQFKNGVWPAPDGSVDIFSDVIAILQAFGSRSTAPALFRADLIGVGAAGLDCQPDQVIDIQDIVGAVGGFSGLSYEARTGCGVPCP